jgi:hypothetical protein
MHLVAVNLNLMSSDDRKKVILLKYLFDWLEAEFDRALSFLILHEPDLHAYYIHDRVSPEQIAEDA